MANENNIVDYSFNKLSTEKQRKIASMGGKKSGEVRREKATMKKVLMDMLEEIGDKENNLTYKQLATLGLIKGAVQGNAQNYKTILETTGEVETSSGTPEVTIKVVDNTDFEKVMYDEKEN